MNHALKFWNVALCLVDLDWGFFHLHSSYIQLLVKRICSIYKCLSLLVEHLNSSWLSITLLFPFGKSAISLVNGSLLSLSQLLTLSDGISDVFIFSFKSLVVRECGLHFMLIISDLLVSLGDLYSNGLCLLGDLYAFSVFISILVLENLNLAVKTVDDICLTLDLSLIISLKWGNTQLKCLLSSSKIFNMCLDHRKVSLVDLMWLDLHSVACNDSISNALAHLEKINLPLSLILSFRVLIMLSLVSLLSVLLI